MIALEANYEYSRLIPNDYQVVHRYNIGTSGNYLRSEGYVQTIHIRGALLPYVFNDIKYNTKTYCCNSIDDEDLTMETLIHTYYESVSNLDAAVLYVYANSTEDVDRIYNRLDSDTFKTIPSEVQSLYNKCYDQVNAREGLDKTINVKAKISRDNKLLVLISNHYDYIQASEVYLTIGLTPILFTNIKDKFNEKEINYFKVLVQRSQLKRITNVDATNAFSDLLTLEKYKEIYSEISFRMALENIVDIKIRNARSTLNNAESNATSHLRSYTEACSKYYEAQKTLEDLENNADSVKEEFKNACKIEGLINVCEDNGILYETYVSTLNYFNPDEAEIVINKMPDSWVKTFFTKVFIDQTLFIRVASQFQFNMLRPGDFHLRYPDTSIYRQHKACMNPHLHYHACLGNYRSELANAHAKSDITIFNNLALASTRSLNFGDGIVFNEFKNFFLNEIDWTDVPFILDEDGNEYTMLQIKEMCINEETTD